jgi:S1-C subfamily serine protease
MEQFDGASFADIPDNVELPDGNAGAYVASVTRGSKAYRQGLRKGDVIKGINGEDVSALDEFEQAVSDTDGVAVLTVMRGRRQIFLAFR